jgi:mevalonate kinase
VTSFSASACAKVILFGEHAVVYGRPAVALPLPGLRARAQYLPGNSPFSLDAPQIGVTSPLAALPAGHPLRETVQIVSKRLGLELRKGTLRIASEIPMASGLGSGAAVTTAIVRALASAHGVDLAPAQVSAIVFEAEAVYHRTPSGIDNSVIALERAIVFVRGTPPQPLALGAPFDLTIADSGVRSKTRVAVGAVHDAWQRDTPTFERLFDDMGACARQSLAALAQGDLPQVGALMNRNQDLLVSLGVSTAGLERLVQAARRAGALGAKLTGAGMGGNVIALGKTHQAAAIGAALEAAGARWVRTTTVQP